MTENVGGFNYSIGHKWVNLGPPVTVQALNFTWALFWEFRDRTVSAKLNTTQTFWPCTVTM